MMAMTTFGYGLTRIGSELRQDVRFGLRLIGRSPGFTAVAALTLALGIGANSAVFSVVNSLLMRPLPIAAPDDVLRIHTGQNTTSWPDYEDIRDRATVFSGVAAHRILVTGLDMADRPVRLFGESASINFFSLLGVNAALGRPFLASDTRRDLVVLADHVWRSRFGADPRIIGRVLSLAGRPHEVIGVMPKGFRGVAPPGPRLDFWVPVDATARNPALSNRALPQFEIVGRLKPGVAQEQAHAELRILGQRLTAEYPTRESPLDITVFSVQGFHAFRGMGGLLIPVLAFLGLMTIVSGFVLLIACANIAGLLISRASVRRREMAMRLALGAGRNRLVRQLLTEGLLLALLGGTAGVLLAVWLARGIGAAATRLPIAMDLGIALDGRVLLYTLGLSTLTSIVFGLAPARRAARVDVISALKDDAMGATGRQRLRHFLIIGQVAVCTMLLVWSGLFLGSLMRINEVRPGFNPTGVLLANIMLEPGSPSDTRGDQILMELQQRVGRSIGVVSTGLANVIPLALQGNERFYVTTGAESGRQRHGVSANRVTPGWFATLEIPFVAGRDFTWDDRAGAPDVIVVNETLANLFWNGDAIGKRVTYGKRTLEVIGVVRDSKYSTLGEAPVPTVYQSFHQVYTGLMTLHVRTEDSQATTAAILQELHRLAPGVAVEIMPMTEAVGAAIIPARIGAIATAVSGMMAMLLSALGIYGLVSYVVAQRTREIGVRRAIGASTPAILGLVIAGTARLTAIGLLAGLGVGAAGGMLLGGFIFGISPTDPETLLGVAALVIGATVLASTVPALRAARVDPLVALRSE